MHGGIERGIIVLSSRCHHGRIALGVPHVSTVVRLGDFEQQLHPCCLRSCSGCGAVLFL